GYRGRDLREGRAPVFREVQAAIDGAEVDDARRRDRDLGDGGDWRSLWAPIYARRRRITIDGPPDPVGTGEQCGRVRRIHGKKDHRSRPAPGDSIRPCPLRVLEARPAILTSLDDRATREPHGPDRPRIARVKREVAAVTSVDVAPGLAARGDHRPVILTATTEHRGRDRGRAQI